MASTMTLAQMRTAIRQRADMEATTFVTDSELNSYINQSCYELYDLLVQKFGDDYFVASPQSITTTSSQTYALSADFYKLLGVDMLVNGSDYITLKPFNFAERNNSVNQGGIGRYGRSFPRYSLKGSNLWLTPVPDSAQTLRVWYVPRFTELSADGSTFDGISGWTEYIITDGAIKCGQKEETDVSVLLAQKMALIKRIESAAENRDAGAPATVGDVSSNNGMWPDDGMGWY